MKEGENVTLQMAATYRDLFVNRGAYTVQSKRPDPSGRHNYFRPKGERCLSLPVLCQHLDGALTIALYAINPRTQRSKWLAMDADYPTAIKDLLKLRRAMKADGLAPALEHSRRGGHLWVFATEPLPARHWRLYAITLADRLGILIKGGKTEGIEIFPRHDELDEDEFGNAIRGPFGVHRATAKRYWFYDANKTISAQLAYLTGLEKVTPDSMRQLIEGLVMPERFCPKPEVVLPPPSPTRREFRILEHVHTRLVRSGKDYRTRCPSCAKRGEDKHGKHLAILIADSRTYRCWGGCTKEEIRAAVGCPIQQRRVS
jgi:hypothetical protein